MAKLKSNGLKKIDLDEIIIKDNVRADYNKIEELAESIKLHGQMVPANITKDNVLIAGHRRYYATKLLQDRGESGFNTLDCVYISGNRRILQLTENIQREDLSASEKEKALKELIKEEGITQNKAAEMLGKTKGWVSQVLSAGDIRDDLEAGGLDTSKITTDAALKLRHVPKEDIPKIEIELNGEKPTVRKCEKVAKQIIGNPDIEKHYTNIKCKYHCSFASEGGCLKKNVVISSKGCESFNKKAT